MLLNRHALLLVTVLVPTSVAQTNIPATGRNVPELGAYDAAIRTVMQKWAIPGASVAITDQGRLVYARGFGFADREAGVQVQPASVFRMASISKTLTGMTILRLIQDGRLALDSKALDLIPNIQPIPGIAVDQRTRQITVQQLLQHTGGWAKEIPEDASLQFTTAARALNIDRATITPDHMARFIISQGLDFAPGTRYYYSQAGYLLLGRIIERITGKKYEDAVKEVLLTPAGAAGSFKIGKSLYSQKEPAEVKYYNYPGAPRVTTTPVVPGATVPYDRPYGSFWVEQAEAYGGWIGNAIDVMRYINALEGRRGGSAILNANSIASITRNPVNVPSSTNPVGLTWRLTSIGGGAFHWWHSGGATGTRNLLARRNNNRDWVVLMNMRPEDEDSIITDLFTAFADAETKSPVWPTHDLFADFNGPALAIDPPALSFRFTQGGVVPPAQTINVTTAPASSGTAFTIAQPAASATWLKFDRLSATAPAAVNVSIDPAGLAPGNYETTVTVNAPQTSNGAISFRVTLAANSATTFTSIRSAATLEPITAAAPSSRIVLDLPAPLTSGEAGGLPPLSATIGGVEAEIVEASATQVELIVPASAPLGEAVPIVLQSLTGAITLEEVVPLLYQARLTGPQMVVLRSTTVGADTTVVEEPVYVCESSSKCEPVPIDLGALEDETTVVQLRIPLTGARSRGAIEDYSATIGDVEARVTALVPAESLPGIDWITITIPKELAGRAGEAGVAITVGEKRSNELKVFIK
jgi:uncharacterized protein (TIGR03437 family)